jgi:hypothetical protein
MLIQATTLEPPSKRCFTEKAPAWYEKRNSMALTVIPCDVVGEARKDERDVSAAEGLIDRTDGCDIFAHGAATHTVFRTAGVRCSPLRR